jgi:hypothetical protein
MRVGPGDSGQREAGLRAQGSYVTRRTVQFTYDGTSHLKCPEGIGTGAHRFLGPGPDATWHR